MSFAKSSGLPIVGLSYKEVSGDGETDVAKLQPEAEQQMARKRAAAWLAQHGNPYLLTALDVDGRVGIDYGVYGVPETYVIDKAGVIRLKHIGPVTPDIFTGKILPLVAELNR